MSAAGARQTMDSYAWLAKREQSRFFPAVSDLFRSVDAGAAAVAADAVTHGVRNHARKLRRAQLRVAIYTVAAVPGKRSKYRHRVAAEQQVLADIAVMLGVDLIPKGRLSALMDQHGSDKASGRHNYTLLYERLLATSTVRPLRVFELGIGSNHSDMPFNMGSQGIPGASLRAWRDYFANAMVFGGDIDRRIMFEEDRIATVYVDQNDRQSIAAAFDGIGGEFDLIVDDGCHELSANRTFFDSAFRRLRSGGLFIIEDVVHDRRDAYKEFVAPYDAAIVDIPNSRNRWDNCLAVIAKP